MPEKANMPQARGDRRISLCGEIFENLKDEPIEEVSVEGDIPLKNIMPSIMDYESNTPTGGILKKRQGPGVGQGPGLGLGPGLGVRLKTSQSEISRISATRLTKDEALNSNPKLSPGKNRSPSHAISPRKTKFTGTSLKTITPRSTTKRKATIQDNLKIKSRMHIKLASNTSLESSAKSPKKRYQKVSFALRNSNVLKNMYGKDFSKNLKLDIKDFRTAEIIIGNFLRSFKTFENFHSNKKHMSLKLDHLIDAYMQRCKASLRGILFDNADILNSFISEKYLLLVIYINIVCNNDQSKFNAGEWSMKEFSKFLDDFQKADLENSIIFFIGYRMMLPRKLVISEVGSFLTELINLERFLRRENQKSKDFIMGSFKKSVHDRLEKIDGRAEALLELFYPDDVLGSNAKTKSWQKVIICFFYWELDQRNGGNDELGF
jgi:hypothetical protein